MTLSSDTKTINSHKVGVHSKSDHNNCSVNINCYSGDSTSDERYTSQQNTGKKVSRFKANLVLLSR